MSDCSEVLFISEASGSLQCVDPRIGTTFVTYRGLSSSKPNTFSVIGKDYLLAADGAKPVLQVWPLNSQEPVPGPKNVVGGRVTAIATSSDGVHCIVAIEAKLHVYQVSSGQVVDVLSKHYRDVSKLLFMDDSCHFVSCGENGTVFVWNLGTAVSRIGLSFAVNVASGEPLYSFSHHSLKVTDAYVGPGAMKSRLYTSSIDQTCKLYNLRDGSLLLSIVFDSSITALRPNIIESELFIGTKKGELIQYLLDPLPRSLEYSVQNSDVSSKFLNHSKAVTSIQISLDGYLLVSGSEDNQVVVWDIPSRQLLRMIQLKSVVTSLILKPAFENIFTANFQPSIVFTHFQRSYNETSSLEVNVLSSDDMVPIDYCIKPVEYRPTMASGEDTSEDLEGLRRQLEQVQAKNKQLYQFAMEKVIGNPYAFGV